MIHITAIDYAPGHPMRQVIDTLVDAGDYFDSRADCEVVGDPGEPRPNEEMVLLCGCNEALEVLGESADMLNECRR